MKVIRIIIAAVALSAMTVVTARAFEMPAIPSGLTAPAERAAWLAVHYWDKMDFGDTAAVTDEQSMGQAVADYITVLQIAGDEAARVAADTLVAQAGAYPDAIAPVCGMLTDYLLDGESPVADEHLFVIIADSMIAAGWPGSDTTRLLRDMAARCLPGTPAPDMALISADGATVMLHDLTAGHDAVLLFYDPDCDECRQIIAALVDYEASATGVMPRIVAVSIGDGTLPLPAHWVDMRPQGDPDDVYAIPATPTLYLIAADGTVRLKNPDVRTLVGALR